MYAPDIKKKKKSFLSLSHIVLFAFLLLLLLLRSGHFKTMCTPDIFKSLFVFSRVLFCLLFVVVAVEKVDILRQCVNLTFFFSTVFFLSLFWLLLLLLLRKWAFKWTARSDDICIDWFHYNSDSENNGDERYHEQFSRENCVSRAISFPGSNGALKGNRCVRMFRVK